MKFDLQFIEQVRQELQKPLPGVAAQYKMAPPYRPFLSKEEVSRLHPKMSGVLLLLCQQGSTINVVLTQRTKYPGVHSGQMSFPGGRQEKGDRDLRQTALRETEEEIGVKSTQIEVIGALSELYIPPSNFMVYPTVGFSAQLQGFCPQKSEVEEIVEIPLDFFLDKKNIDVKAKIDLPNGTKVIAPAYIFNRHIIWGATAIVMSEFTSIAERIIEGS